MVEHRRTYFISQSLGGPSLYINRPTSSMLIVVGFFIIAHNLFICLSAPGISYPGQPGTLSLFLT